MSEKLTLCGCDECEERMEKLLNYVNSILDKYPPRPKIKCKKAREIPDIPKTF